MVESIKSVLMKRDGLTEDEAQEQVNEAIEEVKVILNGGGDFFDLEDICYTWFGLEPDYLDELLYSFI